MTKQEIEKAIENGESVWIIGKDIEGNKRAGTKKLNNKYDEVLNNKLNGFWTLNKIFKTKAEAEHYLHHANITRTETLPFLTWEEFKKEHYFGFNSINNEWINLYVTNGLEPGKKIITIENATKEEFLANYDLTEENFYKAYDECVRLFRGNYE